MTEQTDFTHQLVDVADYLLEVNPQYDRDKYIEDIKLHYKYNTLDFINNKGKITGAVRYNITPSGGIADIIDLRISNKKMLKYFIARGWMRFPSLIYIRYERGLKGDNRKRLLRISKFFNKEKRC